MKRLFLILLGATFAIAPISAKVWRLNPDAAAGADFTSINEAIASYAENSSGALDYYYVSEGDTLYCEPGTYENATISKRLTIIGPGFGDTSNGIQLGSLNCAQFSNITISASYVSVIGLVITNQITTSASSSLPLSYLNIDRCYFNEVTLGLSTSYVNYSTVSNCFFYQGGGTCYLGSNSNVTGNIVYSYRSSNYSINAVDSNIQNNTFYLAISERLNFTGCTVFDNIIAFSSTSLTQSFSGYDSSIYNNIIATTGEEADEFPNNIYGVNNTPEVLFGCEGDLTISADYYKVNDGHAAKTYSTTGGEVGAFGGSRPIVSSFRPLGIPYIYDVTIDQDNVAQTLKLNFKASGQDE